MSEWVDKSPLCPIARTTLASTFVDSGASNFFPAVAIKTNPINGAPSSVVLVGSEDQLRSFQRALDKAIVRAIQGARGKNSQKDSRLA